MWNELTNYVRSSDMARATIRLAIFCYIILSSNLCAAPLTTLEYRIVGTQLRVDPPTLSVPKGVPGSVNVDVVFGDGTKSAQGIAGAHVEATLRGPSFPARRLVGTGNE